MQVLQVISCRALRSKVKSGKVTDWTGQTGTCDKIIYFDKHSLESSFIPTVGTKVSYKGIKVMCVYNLQEEAIKNIFYN